MNEYTSDSSWVGEMGFGAGCKFAQLESREGKQGEIEEHISGAFVLLAMKYGTQLTDELLMAFTNGFLEGFFGEQCYEFQHGYGTDAPQAQ